MDNVLFRSLDQAIIVSKDIGDLSDIFTLAMKASHYYQQQGSPESASSLLNKTADILLLSDPESSVKLLKEASNICGVCLNISIYFFILFETLYLLNFILQEYSICVFF